MVVKEAKDEKILLEVKQKLDYLSKHHIDHY